MIPQKEILQIADELGIQSFVIDKDWVLGHFLNAMFSFEDIKQNFIFKGGTCLKKCYFENYRFSEDLDFTLTDKKFSFDDNLLQKIIKLAEKNSGAKFYLNKIKPQVHKDINQGYEAIILFWGADHKPNQKQLPVNRWHTKIKIDISFSEKVILSPENKDIYHSYSDSDKLKNKVMVYPLIEVVAEKLRSLIQRNRPRDYYDLYFLSSIIEDSSCEQILEILKAKSQIKNIQCCEIESFINSYKYRINKRAWQSSLEYHLPQGKLVDYDDVYKTLEIFITKILGSQK
jgi:predicted nucleotidyltransferase component of viral defense system